MSRPNSKDGQPPMKPIDSHFWIRLIGIAWIIGLMVIDWRCGQ
jgi:hypothetical protein